MLILLAPYMQAGRKVTQPSLSQALPIIPVTAALFPNQTTKVYIDNARLIEQLRLAKNSNKPLALVLAVQEPTGSCQDMNFTISRTYNVGTLASVVHIFNAGESLPYENNPGGALVLLQGISRARAVSKQCDSQGSWFASYEHFEYTKDTASDVSMMLNKIKELALEIAKSRDVNEYGFNPYINLSQIQKPEEVGDFLLYMGVTRVDEFQELLEYASYYEFLDAVYGRFSTMIKGLVVASESYNKAMSSLKESQRKLIIEKQIETLKKELGENDSDTLFDRLAALDLPDDIRSEVDRHAQSLKIMHPQSGDFHTMRQYLEVIAALPWGKTTVDNLDIAHAKQILDEDHYKLTEIKERILDFIAVRQLKKDGDTPILCFVGPPGTGKTSLGKSIARCLERHFVRISLGGVSDEAEIRGHRRTYVGSIPGRLVDGMRKAGSMNPVILLDEIDKVERVKGNPAAALLEVLDPEQNNSFTDNYLALPFDLSQVLFIATANNLATIPKPLRDRMEIIQLSSYTMQEKVRIAQKYLTKKANDASGLEASPVSFSDEFLADVIQHYTQEAGVRELERVLKKLCSKVARSLVEKDEHLSFDKENVEQYLGPYKFIQVESSAQENQVGITNGLAWTPYGGVVLKVEAVVMPGTGKLLLTGSLGDVMRESAQMALSYARAHAHEFAIQPNMFRDYDLHIHVPAGAVPKDGPSAGVTLLTSILSALTGRQIDNTYAMTGELNLRGHVMPIGGVKEKVLAAKRHNIPHVLLPLKNKKDLVDAEEATSGIDIIWVGHANEVLNHVLMR